MNRNTMRCGVCSINWPHSEVYRFCPICGEETKNVHLAEDNDDPIYSEREANDHLVEEGLRPRVTGTGTSTPTPFGSRLAVIGFQRAKEQLYHDLERWTKEAPPWARR